MNSEQDGAAVTDRDVAVTDRDGSGDPDSAESVAAGDAEIEDAEVEDAEPAERGSVFPASLEIAWGLRTRPHKGPRRGLSLAAIVSAAVTVADTEGMDAVSMSRVAKELGASTMALYRYVATKDELVVLMVDTALGPPNPLPEDIGWRDGLRQWAHRTRDALLAHPWAIPLLAANGPPVTPNQLAWLDQALRLLRDTGLAEVEKVATALLVSEQVRGEVSVTVAMASQDDDGRWSEYTPFLLRATADGRLPALRAAVESGVFQDIDPATAEEDRYDDYGFGLERLLDGIAAYMER